MRDSDIQARSQTFTDESLAQEKHQYTGTGGISDNNREQGLIPACMDTETGNVYRSRFPGGNPRRSMYWPVCRINYCMPIIS